MDFRLSFGPHEKRFLTLGDARLGTSRYPDSRRWRSDHDSMNARQTRLPAMRGSFRYSNVLPNVRAPLSDLFFTVYFLTYRSDEWYFDPTENEWLLELKVEKNG